MKHSKQLFLLFISTLITFSAVAQSTLKERLTKHVYTLASDSLQGRKTGTVYAEKAADYIINEWTKETTHVYPDTVFSYTFGEDNIYRNVVNIIHGSDENLKDEYIVVGAHYDHLGVQNDKIYNGADDNASGVAALIELGKELKSKQSQLKRSVVLVAFDAEEIGLVGSTDFVNSSFAADKNIKLMLSVDMVGWYKASGNVVYYGAGTIENGVDLIKNSKVVPSGLNVVTKKYEGNPFVATDTAPFAKNKIPTYAVTTGMKSPYHKPEDDAELIDYDGLTLITRHLTNLVEYAANKPDLEPTGRRANKHVEVQRFNIGVVGNIGSNSHRYTDGPVNGKNAFSYGIGLTTQLNFKRVFGIRPEVYFEQVRAKHPEGLIKTDNLTIPVSGAFQIVSGGAGVDFSLGGYYTYRFDGKQGENKIDFENKYNQEEFGLTYGFGVWMRPFKIGFTSRRALTNFTKYPNADNAHIRNRANYFTIGLVF